ncbi:MAG: hypothetical protein AB7O98_05900 [Hyphomonadaceae bacterium]
MIVILWAFSLFHLVVGVASLGLAVRLLTAEERAHWRSERARLAAEVLCWVYPLLAFASASIAWRSYHAGEAHAFPLMLAPIAWLIAMGVVFAVVDFAEDGILGNARRK